MLKLPRLLCSHAISMDKVELKQNLETHVLRRYAVSLKNPQRLKLSSFCLLLSRDFRKRRPAVLAVLASPALLLRRQSSKKHLNKFINRYTNTYIHRQIIDFYK